MTNGLAADAHDRAHDGATFLDLTIPGWHKRVDPFILDLGYGRLCVLGQLDGNYWSGLTHLNLIEGHRMGFSVPPDLVLTPAEDEYLNHLRDAWQAELRARVRQDEGVLV